MNNPDTGSSNPNTMGLIFNIQPFSIHDGPGIRTTVFMKGCPLTCEWCSNPDSWNTFPEIMTRDIKCIGCGICADACPLQAITITRNGREIDRSKCNQCLGCVGVCDNEAIYASGTYMRVDEIVAEVIKDKIFYKNSGGGVTFSGGEPLLQREFLGQVLESCKQNGVHTALDTTGYAPWENIESVINYVDLVLFDVKHMDPEIHRHRTGVSNELILGNLQRIASKVKTWVRIPVIPGFNDTDSDILQIADFVSTLGVEKVSLLPYHGLGQAKCEALGREYRMKPASHLSDEQTNRLCQIVKTAGLMCTVKH